MAYNNASKNASSVKSSVFYPQLLEAVRTFEDEEIQCRVLCSIIEYGLYGKPIDVSDIDPDGSISEIVASIKEDMDARKAERNKRAKTSKNEQNEQN